MRKFIMEIKYISKEKIVNKIKQIDIDGIIDSYYINEFLKPHKASSYVNICGFKTYKTNFKCT